MADGEIEISELEFEENLAGDLVFPVENASDTKATDLTTLKGWLKQFFAGMTDNETITGLKNFSNDGSLSDNSQVEVTAKNINVSSAPASSKYAGLRINDTNGTRIGKLEVEQYSSGAIGIRIVATNNGTHGLIGVQVATNGTITTTAPTPPTSSNTTEMATTAWVKTVLSGSGNGLATISKSGNGYCKFTNGLIIQWGRVTSLGNENSGKSVTLPTAFTSTNYRVAMTGRYGSRTINTSQALDTGTNYTTTTFKFFSSYCSAVDWLAIGY